MALHLVRHGAPTVDPSAPASSWPLDPGSYDAVWSLRARLPDRAAWFSSPEPKALETAQLLTDSELGVIDGLREHEREAGWYADFSAVVRKALATPRVPAVPGWEPAQRCRRRVVSAVQPLLAAHLDLDVVLVGHGTAWTLLVSELTGDAPDLERWESLSMPDLIVLEQNGAAPGRWQVAPD